MFGELVWKSNVYFLIHVFTNRSEMPHYVVSIVTAIWYDTKSEDK